MYSSQIESSNLSFYVDFIRGRAAPLAVLKKRHWAEAAWPLFAFWGIQRLLISIYFSPVMGLGTKQNGTTHV